MDTCETCKFFKLNGVVKEVTNNSVQKGNCKRYPPVILVNTMKLTNQPFLDNKNPVVRIDDWCGEYTVCSI